MTVIAAVKVTKGGKTYVVAGADGEVSTDEYRLHAIKETSKLLRIKNFAVGLCGAGPLLEILEDIRDNKKSPPAMIKTRRQAKDFAERVYADLKDHLERGFSPPDMGNHISPLLILTPQSIFLVYTDLSTYEFDKFAVVGVGADVAKGALHILYEQLEQQEKVTREDMVSALEKALMVSCTHVLHCNPPLEIINV